MKPLHLSGMHVLQAKRRALHERPVLHGPTADAHQTLHHEGAHGPGAHPPGRGRVNLQADP